MSRDPDSLFKYSGVKLELGGFFECPDIRFAMSGANDEDKTLDVPASLKERKFPATGLKRDPEKDPLLGG